MLVLRQTLHAEAGEDTGTQPAEDQQQLAFSGNTCQKQTQKYVQKSVLMNSYVGSICPTRQNWWLSSLHAAEGASKNTDAVVTKAGSGCKLKLCNRTHYSFAKQSPPLKVSVPAICRATEPFQDLCCGCRTCSPFHAAQQGQMVTEQPSPDVSAPHQAVRYPDCCSAVSVPAPS